MSIEKQARIYARELSYEQLTEIATSKTEIAQKVAAARWVLDALDGKEKARDTLVARESGAIQQSTKIEVTQLSPEQVLESIALERERLELASEND